MGRDLDAVTMSEEQSRVHSLCEEITQCAKALGQARKKHKHEPPTDATNSPPLEPSSSSSASSLSDSIEAPVVSQLERLSTAEVQQVLSELRKRKAINSTTLKLLLSERVEVLELSDEFVSDALLRRVMLKCPKLRELHLGNAFGAVTNMRLAEIVAALPLLTTSARAPDAPRGVRPAQLLAAGIRRAGARTRRQADARARGTSERRRADPR